MPVFHDHSGGTYNPINASYTTQMSDLVVRIEEDQIHISKDRHGKVGVTSLWEVGNRLHKLIMSLRNSVG